jgi:ATP-dependent Clp protease ATP-binding subunit ClpA
LNATDVNFLSAQGLDRQQIGTIVRLQAKRVADRLASRKIKLELDDSAVEWLADKVCGCASKHQPDMMACFRMWLCS